MELEKIINADLKQAMLAKDTKKLESLRAIKAALLLEKTGKDVNWSGEIPDQVELKLLQKLVKMRRESAELYTQQNRSELAAEELFQAGIIQSYLPEQISNDELKNIIQTIINQVGAQGAKDMGKVIGLASQQLSGRAENKAIADTVKTLLNL